MTCKQCQLIKSEIIRMYDEHFGIDVDQHEPKMKSQLCITCENKHRFDNLPDDQKILIVVYEKTLAENDSEKSMTALQKLMDLGIDSITVPK